MALKNEWTKMEYLPRSEIIKRFEIDCGHGIMFSGGSWQPGGEYVQKLHIKNCSTRMQKIKYKLPQSKYFTMAFPEVISLSPGTSAVIDVVFRPVKLEEYEDSIYVTVHSNVNGRKEGGSSFHIPVIARLARLDLEFPPGIDLGFCPTNETTEYVFTLSNSGQLNAVFDWRVPGAGPYGHPLLFAPSSGTLSAGSSVEIKVSFKPSSASVFVSTILCSYKELGGADQKGSKKMKVSGIGKFSHITTSESRFDFGDVLIPAVISSQSAIREQEFVIRNGSLVPAKYQIISADGENEPSFIFRPSSGVILPGSEFPVKVGFSPLVNGLFSCERFKIITPGGNAIDIVCTAKAVGPAVSISIKADETPLDTAEQSLQCTKHQCLNFGDLEVNNTRSRSFILANHSEIPAFYCFIVEDNGIFMFDSAQGIIPPKFQKNITITFLPTQPINFYKRVFCLIKDQLPLYVDLLGTGYDDKTRPAPMSSDHIFAARYRSKLGYGRHSPEELAILADEGEKEFFVPGVENVRKQEAQDVHRKLLTRSGDAIEQDVEICREYYISVTESSREVYLGEIELDFGGNLFGKLPEKKTVHVTNNTNAKIACHWSIPGSDDDDDIPDFEVIPGVGDIAPGKTAQFKVAFRPTQENFFYCQQIECYCFHKTNRNFRLVDERVLTPPWCLPVRVLGHTFGPHAEHFLPKVSLGVPKNTLCFPPCHIGDSVYQTIMLENRGDTPAQFRFMKDTANTFSVCPDGGMIPIQSFQLVMVRFTPQKPQRYRLLMQCVLNNATGSNTTVTLDGFGCEPRLEFDDTIIENDNKLFIKPTAVGLSSYRTFQVINRSQIPVIYRWELPTKLTGIVNVLPMVGRLKGSERASISCTFSPQAQRQYSHCIKLKYKNIGLPSKSWDAIDPQLSLRLIGEGGSGKISFRPSELVLSTVLVNMESSGTVTLINENDCDLSFYLQIDGAETTNFKAIPASGVIPAHAHLNCKVIYKATVQERKDIHIQCFVVSEEVKQSRRIVADCKITCSSSFPTLQIVDVASSSLPMAMLWRKQNIAAINSFLASPLTKDEIIRNASAKMFAEELQSFDVAFIPAKMGSAAETLYLEIRNTCAITTEFVSRYPNESEIEIASWDSEGEPTEDQVKQNTILDNKLFDVFPRKGTLKPQESLTLQMKYHYVSTEFEGRHAVPIYFKILNGKSFVIWLRGETLSSQSPSLFLESSLWDLKSVPLGLGIPPAHVEHIFNVGDTAFDYEMDLGSLVTFSSKHMGINVFKIENSRGTIKARSSREIKIFFSPLEQREYSVKIPLYIYLSDNGSEQLNIIEQHLISIKGKGFLPEALDAVQNRLISSMPRFPSVTACTQPARLSMNMVQYGYVPVGATRSELIFLEGMEGDRAVQFEFRTSRRSLGLVEISPSVGIIKPGQKLLITVKLRGDLVDKPISGEEDFECRFSKVKSRDAAAHIELNKGSALLLSPKRSSVVFRGTLSWESRVEENKIWKGINEMIKARESGKANSAKGEPGLTGAWSKDKEKKLSVDDGGSLKKQDRAADTRPSVSGMLQAPPQPPIFLSVGYVFLEQHMYEQFWGSAKLNTQHLTKGTLMHEPRNVVLQPFAEDKELPRFLAFEVIEPVLISIIQELSLNAVSRNLPISAGVPYFTQFAHNDHPQAASSADDCTALKCEHGWDSNLVSIVRTSDFRATIGDVFENTMANLIQEVVTKEFSLHQLPKDFRLIPKNISS